jgi:excisionase family DNA binding protein
MSRGQQDNSGGDVEPRFYTLEQTASYLNVSVPQVYSLVRSGRLPAIKIGGRGVWRVPVDTRLKSTWSTYSRRPNNGFGLTPSLPGTMTR